MDAVRHHYERYTYPRYPLLASVRSGSAQHLNLQRLWARYNTDPLPRQQQTILIAGCGSFAPYPFSLANPRAKITALDLSTTNLKRARLHCLLHLRLNVTCRRGDLLDPDVASGPFSLIDAYGVLHHLPDPGAGLQALRGRLADNGLLRVMLYSHGARKGTEAARRALRRLKVRDVTALRGLYDRLPSGSRLARRLAEAPDGDANHGLADAFLHPQVTTFRVTELKALLAESGMELLAFLHTGALTRPADEWQRLQQLEANGALDINYLFLLRKNAVQNPHIPAAKSGKTAGRDRLDRL